MDGAPILGGDIMVTWEALTCMFTFGLLLVMITFGLLLVAVIALFVGNNK